jgi:predicted DNA-binding WGR domain protein
MSEQAAPGRGARVLAPTAKMTAIALMRTDHARNMCRYYRLDVQPDLFGAWCFGREWAEWGRIGQAGQTRTVPYPTPDAAEAALLRQRCVKERRGYAPRAGRLGVR